MLSCLSGVLMRVAVASSVQSLFQTVRSWPRVFSTNSGSQQAPISMAQGLEKLRQGKVIPDVVDRFQDDKVLDLRVSYDGVEVANGAKLRVAQAQPKPHVEFRDPGFRDHLHTVLMVDPDAPSPKNPTFRHFLHWIVTDVPGSLQSTQEIWEQGREVVPYMGPAPPEGEHRYVFLAYRQPQTLDVQPPQARKNFDVKAFARQYNLSLPLAAVYFVSEYGQ